MNQYEKIQEEIDGLKDVLKGLREVGAEITGIEIIESIIKSKEHNLRMLLMQD
tara:strand:+ start:448 stop:606 length:159 start_codon:yes stop_codon:yes gene_type:complete